MRDRRGVTLSLSLALPVAAVLAAAGCALDPVPLEPPDAGTGVAGRSVRIRRQGRRGRRPSHAGPELRQPADSSDRVRVRGDRHGLRVRFGRSPDVADHLSRPAGRGNDGDGRRGGHRRWYGGQRRRWRGGWRRGGQRRCQRPHAVRVDGELREGRGVHDGRRRLQGGARLRPRAWGVPPSVTASVGPRAAPGRRARRRRAARKTRCARRKTASARRRPAAAPGRYVQRSATATAGRRGRAGRATSTEIAAWRRTTARAAIAARSPRARRCPVARGRASRAWSIRAAGWPRAA